MKKKKKKDNLGELYKDIKKLIEQHYKKMSTTQLRAEAVKNTLMRLSIDNILLSLLLEKKVITRKELQARTIHYLKDLKKKLG